MTYQQSGGLFSSKEQESESKAQLLKRLAFVIYSSEKDQYQKNMPEIQGNISSFKPINNFIANFPTHNSHRMYFTCAQTHTISEPLFDASPPI